MTPNPGSQAAAALAVLLLASALACDSLTTPEERTARLQLLLQVEGAVDTANIQTGDTLDLVARVVTETDTVPPKSQMWASASNDTLEVLAADAGRFRARRVGRDTAFVEAIVDTEFAGDVTLRGAVPVTIRGELFLGSVAPTTVRFRDAIRVDAPAGQRFSDTTGILFTPDREASDLNFIPGFVRTPIDSASLTALVPAGFDSGRITLTGIASDGRTLDSQVTVTRLDTDTDRDGFENNDTEASAAEISVPLGESVASIDREVETDVDFFKFVPSSSRSWTITLNWNVPSNLDFEVYHYDLLLVRVTDLNGDGTDTSGESGTTPTLQAGVTHFLRVYAADLVAPTTYLLTIE